MKNETNVVIPNSNAIIAAKILLNFQIISELGTYKIPRLQFEEEAEKKEKRKEKKEIDKNLLLTNS